ncbi:oxygenase MpaB family protein [Nocardia sp.]|uniref:oxygenase MpaB family protein n=1 Tax=Nocardia sp. TaxID=1821 RepID=UPI00258CD3A8|nr:oxygenase MpaB family protein [Nocardia sp.]
MNGPEQAFAHPPMVTAGLLGVAARRLAPGDIRASAEQCAAYLRYTRRGDPPADAVIAMTRRLPGGHGSRMIDTAIEQGIDAVPDPPPELVAFFDSLAMPYWVDTAQLELASRVTARTGAAGFTALTMALLGGYLASRVAKTLVASGELEHMAPRRLAETAAWFAQVTDLGGLQPDAPGYKATLRVRLVHAKVRAGLAATPGWDLNAWHHPLNQSQLAGTTMLFAWSLINGSRALGLKFTARERAAVYHQWRYTGFLLGIDTAILPVDEADAWRLWWIQAQLEFANPDQDSQRLAHALIHAIGPVLVGNSRDPLSRAGRIAVTEVMSAYARLVLGSDHADFLRPPDRKSVQAFVIAAAIATAALEYPRRVLPGATRCAETLGRHARSALTCRMATTQGRRTAAPTNGGYRAHPDTSNSRRTRTCP